MRRTRSARTALQRLLCLRDSYGFLELPFVADDDLDDLDEDGAYLALPSDGVEYGSAWSSHWSTPWLLPL